VAEAISGTIKLNIITPERRLVENFDAVSVTLYTSEGQIQLLPGHVPLIGTLEVGVFYYVATDGREGAGVISSGFFEVKDDVLQVIAETLELKEEIDIARARRAQEKAEEVLREAGLDEDRFKKYQLKLHRSIVRQKFGAKNSTE